MTLPLLQVEGLAIEMPSPRGPIRVVDDVSFTLRRGETLALVGERGAGKSTTACALPDLLGAPVRIVAGRIVFDGHDLRALPSRTMRAMLGARIALLQDLAGAFDPARPIGTQIVEAVRAHSPIAVAAARERSRACLAGAGIASPDDVLDAWPAECPSGLRVRAAVAMALVNGPALIVADEPLRGLDITLARQIRALLQDRVADTGAAMIWTAADLALVADFADRACVMYAGRIVEEGSLAALLRQPAHPYTRALVDAIPARVGPGTRLRVLAGTAPRRNALLLGCVFRERCPSAIDACVAAPAMQGVGAPGAWRGVRCHNPLPLAIIDA